MYGLILVSVIIPAYNRLAFFKIALRSALNQTYENIEIVVVDDSTNNEIEEYLERFKDKRIAYFKNETPLGIAMNTREGILKSSGHYFAFLNDDDSWCETFVEKLLSGITRNAKIGCAFSDHWLINKDGEILLNETEKNTIAYERNNLMTGVVPSDKRTDLFIYFTVPLAMACIIKREIVDTDQYPAEIGGAYDRWILLQCVKNHDCEFFYCKERLTYYRVHSLSASYTQSVRVVKSVIYILKKSINILCLNKKQKNLLNGGIRVYIRSLVKKKSLECLKYIPLYIQTFL